MKKKYLNLFFDNTLSVTKNPFNIALISIIGIFFTTFNLYSDYNYLPQSPSDTHHYISKAFQIINLSKENYIYGLDHNLFGQDFTRSFNLYFAIIGKFLNNSYASVISINFFYFTISLLPIIKFLNFYFEDKNKTSFILLLLIFLPLFQGIWTPISFYSLLYDATVFYISLASFFSLFLVFLDPYNKSNYFMAGFYFGFLFWTRGNSFLYVLILGFPFLVSLILQIRNKEIQIKKIKFYLILFFSIFFFFLFFKLFYSADLIKSYYSPHSSKKYSIINFINENSLKIFLLEYLNMLLNNPTRFFQDFVTGGENYYLKIQWLYGERNNLLIYDDKRLAFVFYFKLFLSFFSHLTPFLLYFFRNKFFKEKILRKLISLAFFIYLIFLIYMSYITMWSIYGILNPHLTSYILVPYILFFLVFFIKLMKFIPIRFINNFSLIIILIILFTSNFFITKKSFENRKDIITERSDTYNNSLQRITTSKDIESFSKNLNLFTNFNDVVFIWYGYSYNQMFINFFREKIT